MTVMPNYANFSKLEHIESRFSYLLKTLRCKMFDGNQRPWIH